MATLTKKYLFSIAVEERANWLPVTVTRIKQFEVTLPAKSVINTGVVEAEAEKQGFRNFKVLGYLQVGKPVTAEKDTKTTVKVAKQ